jgi:hypothetical protein
MNRVHRAGLVALCACGFGGNWGLAQSFNPFSNFVQIRGFFPFENGNFSSAPALDASLRFPVGAGSFGVKLEALTALRQRAAVDLRLEEVFAGLELRNEPNATSSGQAFSVAGLLLYNALEANVSALRDASVGYLLEADTGTASAYEYHLGEFNLRGDFAQGWNWSLGYTLNSDLNPVRNRVTHEADLWVRTNILEPVTLGVGAGLRARDGRVVYQGSLEAGFAFTDRDALGARVTLTTAPGDEERVFYDTTRVEPWTLGAYLGRSNESALIWGVNASTNTDYGVQFQGQYEARGFGTASHEFSLGVRYGGELGSLALRGGMNLEFDAARSLWFGRLISQFTTNLRFEPFTLEATARVDYGPDRLTGLVEGSLIFERFPWLVLLEADLKFRTIWTGAVTAQGLYFLLPNVAVNLSAVYRWQIAGSGTGGFSFGAGLRYAF